jgi:hypothetical protein
MDFEFEKQNYCFATIESSDGFEWEKYSGK